MNKLTRLVVGLCTKHDFILVDSFPSISFGQLPSGGDDWSAFHGKRGSAIHVRCGTQLETSPRLSRFPQLPSHFWRFVLMERAFATAFQLSEFHLQASFWPWIR